MSRVLRSALSVLVRPAMGPEMPRPSFSPSNSVTPMMLKLDVVTANIEVAHWLANVANERIHGTTMEQPSRRLVDEVQHLQALSAPWRGDIGAARPQGNTLAIPSTTRPPIVIERIAEPTPAQHPLAVYDQLLAQVAQAVAA